MKFISAHLIKLLIPFILLILFFISLSSKAISVSTFTKHSSNPIVSTSTTGWDSSYAWSPSVIFDGTEYKMWYTGYNGSRFQIGLAHSSDGISWIKDNSNPVISRLDIDNKDSHDSSVLYNGSSYVMWYASSNDGGSSNYRIQRAISSNGVSWINEPISTILSPSQLWDAEGLTSPYVLKVGSTYKMWYAARKNDGKWRIGYATSGDGISWTPYAENPVLVGDQTWEGSNVAGPSVIYDGTTYHMWYGTNSGIGPSAIGYATSPDGTSWTKPEDKNPVLTRGASGFDSSMIGDATVLQKEGTTFLWYGALGSIDSVSAWRIGLATDGTFPLPTATPTPTPDPMSTPTPTPEPTATPTPTDTPTPTPTDIPTPTPTPILTTKVILIPGLGASWNQDALWNCKPTKYSGSWSSVPLANIIYGPLLKDLKNQGFTVLPYYYDWRRNVTDNAANLQTFIGQHTSNGEKVDIVAHSLGGLVARAYLEQTGNDHRIDHLMMVGSPQKGTPIAYPAWAAGDIWSGDVLYRLYMTTLMQRCKSVNSISVKDAVRKYIPSIQNLLPTTDYLKNTLTSSFIPVSQMTLKNNWLPTAFNTPFFGATVGTLSGNNYRTIQYITVGPRNQTDALLGVWADGKPTIKEWSSDGDGTVLTSSNNLLNTSNTSIDQSHTGIIQSSQGRQVILAFLLGQTGEQTIVSQSVEPSQPETTSALMVATGNAYVWVTDPSGKVTRDTSGAVTIANPITGSYKIRLIPKTLKPYTFVVTQVLSDGSEYWKEYTRRGAIPSFITLKFDTDHPKEDLLK